MINERFFGKQAEKVTPKNLSEALQQAIEIEVSTIPTYLFTYYSINRSPDQQSLINALTNALLNIDNEPRYTFEEASEIALNFSADIMVFANKTGALIMSVAIEEMLHMALSSNLKQVLTGMPELYGKSPAKWPADLPGHKPALEINLAKLTMTQLETFLNIEKPMKPQTPNLKARKAYIPYPTIGEFYAMVIDCINSYDLKYSTFLAQLVPGKGYYAQNNIDTIYYDKEHKPVFTNEDTSGDLICIADRQSALDAINLIVEQGEGQLVKDAPYLDANNDLIFSALLEYDFKPEPGEEPSHFEKFAEIYQMYYHMQKKYDAFGIKGGSFSDLFIANVRSNPKTAEYPANIAAVSNLINGVYTYIFVMIEECYRKSGSTQYETFMFGIHKSMIFILNSLCGDIMKLTYKFEDKEYIASATFENYNFMPFTRPKAQLQALYATAVAAYPAISYLGYRIDDLPDVDLK